MHSDSIANQYERALTLAESGQYEQALEEMAGYLHLCPEDSKALNDAATILFCMRRGDEAIAYFEKALMTADGDEKIQIYWNLCETYIQEGYPERAAGLFEQMSQEGILNVDTLNRTAEAYLQKENLGGAMEMLHRSLKISPDQEVLLPMMEVIRGRRGAVSVYTHRDSVTAQTLCQSLNQLVSTELHMGDQVVGTAPTQGVSVYVGLWASMVQRLQMNQPGGVILVLGEQDIYSDLLGQVNWSNVSQVVTLASDEAIEDLKQQTGLASVVKAAASCEVDALPLYEKKQGKRIAAMGPWTTRQNPMFLIQCFQKLHYIDPDSRLYLAGEFEDEGLLRYLETTIESMDLDNVVFFDGPVKNPSKWLKNKHYVVSAAIDASSMPGVWVGMAHGLKPVVHRFAGAEKMVGSEYLYNLAEDFCQQIQAKDYDPVNYRRIASACFEENGLSTAVHSAVCELEKERPAQQYTTPAMSPQTTMTPVAQPVMVPVATVNATSVSMSQHSNEPAQGQMTQMNLDIPAAEPAPTQTTGEMVSPSRSIAEIAEQALNASKALHQMTQAEQPVVDLSTSQQEGQQTESTPDQSCPDNFKYNQQQGLTINDLMTPKQEPAGPFCTST